jgi:hypothetical protein
MLDVRKRETFQRHLFEEGGELVVSKDQDIRDGMEQVFNILRFPLPRSATVTLHPTYKTS